MRTADDDETDKDADGEDERHTVTHRARGRDLADVLLWRTRRTGTGAGEAVTLLLVAAITAPVLALLLLGPAPTVPRFLLLMAVLWPSLWPARQLWLLARLYRETRENPVHSTCFRDADVTHDHADGTYTRLPWDTWTAHGETARLLVLWDARTGDLAWLPKRSVPDPDTLAALRAMFARNLPRL
ncbi:hypothetical protein ACN20G_32585 (plasmid) [Streptomyces sp. BI20]|uniref:hypothetical protein n=1 Tax=Streptomyces sp. BI20 TaxID=3403460 RepID=UPI003C72AF62